LINLRKVDEADFRRSEAGAVTMSDDARKTLLVAYQERKREEILHPFIGEKMTIGILFFMQSLLLARHLRGELDGYPPFIWK
ncbi:MAG TPA: subtype I-C CRISPR-associated endonuclease Cas1, partial [Syntrophales bacterium]|nr:subtype I-C CRISPR-associated endonuclease Cas1 [Syntrophales bacterium]